MAITLINSSAVGAINGGAVTLNVATVGSCIIAGDNIIVAMSISNTGVGMNAYSSGGTLLTPLTSTRQGGISNLSFRVHQWIARGGELTIVCSGSSSVQDGNTAAYIVLRGTEKNPDDTYANANSSQPDSPSVSCPSSRLAVISAFGALNVLTTVTAPSGFSTAVFATASDTRSTTTAISWLAVSSAPYDPPAWTIAPGAQWVAASVSLASSGVVEPMLRPFENPDLTRIEVVGY